MNTMIKSILTLIALCLFQAQAKKSPYADKYVFNSFKLLNKQLSRASDKLKMVYYDVIK